jgi:predicted neutral ceramidase superfamily lipid hydrolase
LNTFIYSRVSKVTTWASQFTMMCWVIPISVIRACYYTSLTYIICKSAFFATSFSYTCPSSIVGILIAIKFAISSYLKTCEICFLSPTTLGTNFHTLSRFYKKSIIVDRISSILCAFSYTMSWIKVITKISIRTNFITIRLCRISNVISKSLREWAYSNTKISPSRVVLEKFPS